MIVFYDGRAERDLANIKRWIAKDSTRNAEQVIGSILASIDRLAEFPELGRKTRDPRARQLIIPRLPYIAIYRIDPTRQIIIVTAVFHAAQDRPHSRG